jgi:hypothetical protein
MTDYCCKSLKILYKHNLIEERGWRIALVLDEELLTAFSIEGLDDYILYCPFCGFELKDLDE